jgi:hypothetical protein
MTNYHVIAIPTDEDGTYEGHIIGLASDKAQAIAVCEANGFIVIREGEGGNYDLYDAEDAPHIYGYEADGIGAISITVET